MKDNPPSSGWRLRRWRVPLLLLAVALIGFGIFRFHSDFVMKRQVAQLQARGLPVSPLELDYWYKFVPATNNAALLFLDAAREHFLPGKGKNPAESKEIVVPGEPLPTKLAEDIAVNVKQNALALEKMQLAAEATASRYPIDLSRGVGTLVPHLAQVRQLGLLAKWATIHESSKGNVDAAVRILQSGFALAASLQGEPLLISEMVRNSCLIVLLSALERLVSEHSLSEDQLRQISASLEAADLHEKTAFIRALDGERAIGISLFRLSYREYTKLEGMNGSGDGEFELLKAAGHTARWALGLSDKDLLFFLQSIDSLERSTELEFPERLRVAEDIGRRMENEIENHRWKYAISRMLLPSVSSTIKKEALMVARLRCARLALEIEKYRARHDRKLPTLDQLIPEFISAIPKDPLDGSALEYRAEKSVGYRVLAVASTMDFNEGRKPTDRQDIAFSVPR